MTHVEAQALLADLINKLASVTVCYWWKLQGDESNCLCQFLDMSWSKLRLVLRKCRILYGPTDSFRTSQFEKFSAFLVIITRCTDQMVSPNTS